jgi:hypothetical protein
MNRLAILIQESKELAISEAEKYGLPSPFHVNLSYEVGQRLAKELNADAKIVAVGTYLMDCMLGQAFKEGRQVEHVAMSAEKAKKMFGSYPDIDQSAQENIVACILEHHGVKNFTTLESEICCDADCYRFASVEGFIGGIHNGRKMELKALLDLYNAKADEKWNALSLEICKKELEPQYKAIKNLISNYKEG